MAAAAANRAIERFTEVPPRVGVAARRSAADLATVEPDRAESAARVVTGVVDLALAVVTRIPRGGRRGESGGRRDSGEQAHDESHESPIRHTRTLRAGAIEPYGRVARKYPERPGLL